MLFLAVISFCECNVLIKYLSWAIELGVLFYLMIHLCWSVKRQYVVHTTRVPGVQLISCTLLIFSMDRHSMSCYSRYYDIYDIYDITDMIW